LLKSCFVLYINHLAHLAIDLSANLVLLLLMIRHSVLVGWSPEWDLPVKGLKKCKHYSTK